MKDPGGVNPLSSLAKREARWRGCAPIEAVEEPPEEGPGERPGEVPGEVDGEQPAECPGERPPSLTGVI